MSDLDRFMASFSEEAPDPSLPPPLAALWWDAKGNWARAHALVDELETGAAMAVHAYLHRKEGAAANAAYWYRRAGTESRRASLEDEWTAMVRGLLSEE